MEQIVIAGQQIRLTPMGKDELKDVFIDAILGYDLYKNDCFWRPIEKICTRVYIGTI